MQTEKLYRYPKKPLITGPFRGVILTFNHNMNFDEYKYIHSEMTLKNPNYYRSESDKTKCIIYYKYPYEAATVLKRFEHNTNFKISLYFDKLSRSLRPDILYIQSKTTYDLMRLIVSLQGKIIYEQNTGIQAKFGNFKLAAFAYEELRKTHNVKFTYKSMVHNQSSNKNKNYQQYPDPNKREKIFKIMLETYMNCTPILQNEFKNALKEDNKQIRESQSERAKIAAVMLGISSSNRRNDPDRIDETSSDED